MSAGSLLRPLMEHAFLRNLAPSQVLALAGCASERKLATGELAFREGAEATEVFLVRNGRLALEVDGSSTEVLPAELGAGDAFGWAWIVRGYRWPTDGRAIEPTALIVLDAACVRRKCQSDAALGFQLASRFLSAESAHLAARASVNSPATVRAAPRVRPWKGEAKAIASVPRLHRLAS